MGQYLSILRKIEHCIRTLGMSFHLLACTGHFQCVTAGLSHSGSDLKAKGRLALAPGCTCAFSVAPEPLPILAPCHSRCAAPLACLGHQPPHLRHLWLCPRWIASPWIQSSLCWKVSSRSFTSTSLPKASLLDLTWQSGFCTLHCHAVHPTSWPLTPADSGFGIWIGLSIAWCPSPTFSPCWHQLGCRVVTRPLLFARAFTILVLPGHFGPDPSSSSWRRRTKVPLHGTKCLRGLATHRNGEASNVKWNGG